MRGIIIYCHSCANWDWDKDIRTADGEAISTGHCGILSASCINKVTTDPSSRPPDYQSIEEVVHA